MVICKVSKSSMRNSISGEGGGYSVLVVYKIPTRSSNSGEQGELFKRKKRFWKEIA